MKVGYFMKEMKNKFSITMPPKLQDQADLIATELGMNRISFINLCVANYIENRKVAPLHIPKGINAHLTVENQITNQVVSINV